MYPNAEELTEMFAKASEVNRRNSVYDYLLPVVDARLLNKETIAFANNVITLLDENYHLLVSCNKGDYQLDVVVDDQIFSYVRNKVVSMRCYRRRYDLICFSGRSPTDGWKIIEGAKDEHVERLFHIRPALKAQRNSAF